MSLNGFMVFNTLPPPRRTPAPPAEPSLRNKGKMTPEDVSRILRRFPKEGI